MRIFKTIIAPIAVVEDARTIAAGFDGGAGMFIVPLGTDPGNAPPATAYISSGEMDEGIPPALAGLEGIDISDDAGQAAMTRLGLYRVIDDE